VDINLHSCDDYFAYKALDDGLALFKREQREIRPQELPKHLGVCDDLAPMDSLLLCPGNLLPLLLDLLQLGAECPPPTL
jgi:hypothetical protein